MNACATARSQRFAWVVAGFAVVLVMALVPATARADGATGTLAGNVRTSSGASVADARVAASGPANRSFATTTATDGSFTLNVPPGIYRITVGKAAYVPAAVSDIVVVAGTSVSVAVALSAVDLSSLRTIGSVTVSGRGSTMNTGAATSSYVSPETFANFGNPQINDVLQHVSDVTVEHMGSQPDTTIILNGSQPYETQVLIDGHPVALGQYGVWLSEYFPAFLLGGVETQSGPGNTTPFADIAVAGTVNLLTPGYTHKPSLELVTGADNLGGQYSHLLTTGSDAKLSYVVGLGYDGNALPYFGQKACSVIADNLANTNTPAATGVIQFCGDASGPMFQKGEVVKLKYDFSPATSLEFGFLGVQGGYVPQGSPYGTYLGPTKILGCLTSDTQVCNNPAYASLIGKTIPAYSWYPGSNQYFNQPIFDAQLRRTIGNNTLLVRPYAGNIQPSTVVAYDESRYPQYYSPPGTIPSLAPGTPIPGGGKSLPNGGNAFEQDCGIGFSATGYHQTNSPSNTLVMQNGQEECFQAPFLNFELNKLYGGTASLLHPMGSSLLDLTYDTHATNTFAYINSSSNITVPNTTERITTFSATADLHLIPNLAVGLGLYNTNWKLNGSQAVVDPLTQAAGLAPLTRTVSRFDPHVALVFRPKSSLSYRAAFGTSETFPYAGQVSGLPAYVPPEAAANYQSFLIEKNPFLNPERSISYSLGMDKRFANGGVLALDLQRMVIHDLFEPATFPSTTASETIEEPINVARLHMQLATLRYSYAPRVGLGYNASIAATRSIVEDVPASVYSSGAALPANGVQICGNGQFSPNNPVCIPYLKGYGQLTYTWQSGIYTSLGLDYEGKNNSYFQPPFALVDLTVRGPITKTLEYQVAVENVLNMFNFYNIPYVYQGVPLVEGTPTGLTSRPSTYVPAQQRTIRFQLRYHFGR